MKLFCPEFLSGKWFTQANLRGDAGGATHCPDKILAPICYIQNGIRICKKSTYRCSPYVESVGSETTERRPSEDSNHPIIMIGRPVKPHQLFAQNITPMFSHTGALHRPMVKRSTVWRIQISYSFLLSRFLIIGPVLVVSQPLVRLASQSFSQLVSELHLSLHRIRNHCIRIGRVDETTERRTMCKTRGRDTRKEKELN